MEAKKIEVTQEQLEQALLCCAKDDPAPAGTDPCTDCYLQQMRLIWDGHMSTEKTCFKPLALDAIAYIRRINDFEHGQCAKLLDENGGLQRRYDELNRYNMSCTKEIDKMLVEKLDLQNENAQLRAVITQMDPDFFKRKCRVCGCEWNHPCEGGCSWVGDDLCSKCFSKMLGGKRDENTGNY